MQCWEFKRCGRERGGRNVRELGECPASKHRAGKACWLVAGTFCGGEVQGTFAQKLKNCMLCDFYRRFDTHHRAKMRLEFFGVTSSDTLEPAPHRSGRDTPVPASRRANVAEARDGGHGAETRCAAPPGGRGTPQGRPRGAG